MKTFVLHGMGRTPISMLILAGRLRRAGYPVSLFGYSVTVETLETIARRFLERVRQEVEPEQSYAVVGHSLGNVITRLVDPELPEGFCRFIMLAPPNRLPRSAHLLRRNPLYRAITRDTGQQLADPGFYETLPRTRAPSLILAGTAGPRADWLPLGRQPNDGVLTVEETSLDGVPRMEIPALHTWLMNRGDVFRAIRCFLEQPEGFHGGEPRGGDSIPAAAS